MRLFLADENFPYPVVVALREYGWDVLTLADVNLSESAIPDEVVLQFATEHRRAVITFNRKDFIRLHKIVASHCGIVVCTFDLDFKQLANRIIQTLEVIENLNNQLIRITKQNV
jgi:predicted nuclease of predicted toxin-antitoxin system